MNFDIPGLPTRTAKPRAHGLTMVMDKGLSVRQAEDFASTAAPYVDFVKLGWSTSAFTGGLRDKLAVYRAAGLRVYLGGTLCEVFIARRAFDAYLSLLDTLQLDLAEVSDGSLDMRRDDKLAYIRRLAQRGTVLSEVGSKDAEKVLSAHQWASYVAEERQAGSQWVITESRESGNVGVYRSTGEVRSGLIDEILKKTPLEHVIFEAPKKEQQVWFVRHFGTNVNLGNIAPEELIGLETVRLGLRGDTFHTFWKEG